MKLPKMNTMRIDTLSLNSITLTLLVDQETGGVYWSKKYDSKDKLRNTYSCFKYMALNFNCLDFYIPSAMIDKVIKIDNVIKYTGF